MSQKQLEAYLAEVAHQLTQFRKLEETFWAFRRSNIRFLIVYLALDALCASIFITGLVAHDLSRITLFGFLVMVVSIIIPFIARFADDDEVQAIECQCYVAESLDHFQEIKTAIKRLSEQ